MKYKHLAQVTLLLKKCFKESIIFNTPVLARLYLEKLIRQEEKRVFALSSARMWAGIDLYTASDLLRLLKNDIRNDVCHVIGSGWSLPSSTDKISIGTDYVMGFNFAAVCSLPFDVYFIEGAHSDGDVQRELIQEYASARIGKVFLKNLWQGNTEPDYYRRHYLDSVSLIHDIHMPPLPFHNNDTLKRVIVLALLQKRSKYVVQFGSTIITCIVLAAQLGFKKIVVHGLDFYGPHFFLEGNYEVPDHFLERSRKHFPRQSKQSKHLTANDVTIMLPVIAKELEGIGILLYSGCSISPSSKYLPVYKN